MTAHLNFLDPVGRSQCPSGLKRGSAADRLPELRVRIPPGAWIFVVCCQVEVSATGRSLVQKSPTDFVVSFIVCDQMNNNPLHLTWLGRQR